MFTTPAVNRYIGHSLFMTIVSVSLFALSLLYVCWQTITRPDRRRLSWRLLAVLGAFTALLLLWIQPKWPREMQIRQALLLTPGSSPDSVRQVMQYTQPRPAIFTTDSTTARQFSALQPSLIPDLAYLRRHVPEIGILHLTGYGLPAYELNQLDSLQVIPHLTFPASIIQSVDWPRQVELGDSLRVQLRCTNRGRRPVSFWLQGAGMRLDSVTVATGKTSFIQLKSLPKTAGQQLYYLQRQEQEGLITEKIPFEVREKQPLRLLIIESYPTFGTKFLKNQLAAQGHKIAVRATISKAKFRTEFMNHERIALDRLSTVLLRQFDLVLLDDQTLNNLGAAEHTALQQAIKEGLGILVSVANTNSRNPLLTPFELRGNTANEEQLYKPGWPGAPKGLTAVSFAPLTLQKKAGQKTLITTENGQTLAAMQAKGKGYVGVLATSSTYTWVLDGKPQVYAAFWSYLLQELARRRVALESWQIAPQFPRVNKPVQINVANFADQPPVIQTNRVNVYTEQEQPEQLQWSGTYWPRQKGWQHSQVATGPSHSWYVYADHEWEIVYKHKKYEETMSYLHQRNIPSLTNIASGIMTRKDGIPPIWFFGLFLLCAGYLWLERKL